MAFWSVLSNTADLFQVMSPVYYVVKALRTSHNCRVESESPHALSSVLDAKLKDVERLFDELTMKDKVVHTVIDIRNPTFFKVFVQELERSV